MDKELISEEVEIVEVEEEEKKEPSLKDELEAAFDAAEDDVSDETPDDDAPVEKEEGEEKAEADDDTAEDDVPEDDVEPLKHWSKDDQEKFASLPDESKEFVRDALKRHGENVSQKGRELAERETRLTRYEAFDREFEPIRDELRLAGLDEVQGLRSLVGAHQALNKDPDTAIRWLAQKYGADLSKAAAPNDGTDQFLDPLAGQQLNQLSQKIQTIEQQQQAERARTQQQQAETLQQTVQNFADAKDDKGNVLHPHFEAVRHDMSVLIQAHPDLSMDDAYERAVFANPETRKSVLDAQKEAETRADQAKRKAAATKAKKANAGQRPSAPAKGVPPTGKRPADDLGAMWDQLSTT